MRPRLIALFFWLCIALLGVLCVVFPSTPLSIGGLELRWTTLASVLDLETGPATPTYDTDSLPDLPADCLPDTTELDRNLIGTSTELQAEAKPTVSRPEAADSVPAAAVDTRLFLRRFYDALAETEEHTIRVVHYGDSQIEEDRMTLTLRRDLQGQYGGGGVGLFPLHQSIPTRTIHQILTMNGRVQSTQQGPRRNLVYGPKAQRRSDGLYGPMGQVALMNDSLVPGSEQLTLTIEPMAKGKDSERYFSRLYLLADGDIRLIADGDTLRPYEPLVLPDSTTRTTVRLSGRGQVYGLSAETPTGIIVDNIPMRGSLGTVFTDIDRKQLTRFYRESRTRLIIMQFGGNAIPSNEKPSTMRAVTKMLREQVRYLRSCAPEAAILFVGPSDMATLIDGTMTTYPLLPYLDRLLRQMAVEEQIGYFSLFDAMGGKGSMVRWQQRGLAGSDGVHFTRRGAAVAGDSLAAWLMRIPDFEPLPAPNDSLLYNSTGENTNDSLLYIDTLTTTPID